MAVRRRWLRWVALAASCGLYACASEGGGACDGNGRLHRVKFDYAAKNCAPFESDAGGPCTSGQADKTSIAIGAPVRILGRATLEDGGTTLVPIESPTQLLLAEVNGELVGRREAVVSILARRPDGIVEDVADLRIARATSFVVEPTVVDLRVGERELLDVKPFDASKTRLLGRVTYAATSDDPAVLSCVGGTTDDLHQAECTAHGAGATRIRVSALGVERILEARVTGATPVVDAGDAGDAGGDAQ